MGTAYYYFAASLPMIEFGMKLPVSILEFLLDSERLLSAGDFADMQKALSEEPPAQTARNALLRKWIQFLHHFRNEMVWFRATQANQDPLDHMRGERTTELFVREALNQAGKSADPLTAEKILGRALWQKLDELLQGHYFDFEFLIIYGMKLKILDRFRQIESPRGEEIFKEFKSQSFINEEV